MFILGALNEKNRGIVATKVTSMMMHVICRDFCMFLRSPLMATSDSLSHILGGRPKEGYRDMKKRGSRVQTPEQL